MGGQGLDGEVDAWMGTVEPKEQGESRSLSCSQGVV